MRGNYLTLAALATSAVPDLIVQTARPFYCGEEVAAAVITTDTGEELLVRIPRTSEEEVRESAQLLGLAALTSGARESIGVALPKVLGITRAGDTRAVVTTFIPGESFAASDLQDDAILLAPIAQVLANLHNLPTRIARDGGLPARTAEEARDDVRRLVARTEATRLVPETVLQRWMQVLNNAEVWDFSPTFVHGGLGAEQWVVSEDTVVGLLGWSECGVGDPAADFAWLFESGEDTFSAVFSRYCKERGTGIDPQAVRLRAALYHELSVAKWLLHGKDTHNADIVDDAVAMLDGLVNTGVVLSAAAGEQGTDLAAAEDALAATPAVSSPLSDTAAYDSLDEDRMFASETDVVEPLAEDELSTAEKQALALAAFGADAMVEAADTAEATTDGDSADLETEQYSDEDLALPAKPEKNQE